MPNQLNKLNSVWIKTDFHLSNGVDTEIGAKRVRVARTNSYIFDAWFNPLDKNWI